MIDPKILDDFTRKVANSLPSGLMNLQHEFEKSVRAGLESVLQRLDLVTREEYEVQAALLSRCREQLAMLEQRIQALEKASDSSQTQDNPAKKD